MSVLSRTGSAIALGTAIAEEKGTDARKIAKAVIAVESFMALLEFSMRTRRHDLTGAWFGSRRWVLLKKPQRLL